MIRTQNFGKSTMSTKKTKRIFLLFWSKLIKNNIYVSNHYSGPLKIVCTLCAPPSPLPSPLPSKIFSVSSFWVATYGVISYIQKDTVGKLELFFINGFAFCEAQGLNCTFRKYWYNCLTGDKYYNFTSFNKP